MHTRSHRSLLLGTSLAVLGLASLSIAKDGPGPMPWPPPKKPAAMLAKDGPGPMPWPPKKP
jgi:hypothetical protein